MPNCNPGIRIKGTGTHNRRITETKEQRHSHYIQQHRRSINAPTGTMGQSISRPQNTGQALSWFDVLEFGTLFGIISRNAYAEQDLCSPCPYNGISSHIVHIPQ